MGRSSSNVAKAPTKSNAVNNNAYSYSSPPKNSNSSPAKSRLIGRNHLPKSPGFSPGGYAILKALDDANLSLYQDQKEEEGNEVEGDDGDHTGEEWYDAPVHFKQNDGQRSSHRNSFEAKKNLMDIMDAEKEAEDQLDEDHLHLHSSIVEATKQAIDVEDLKRMKMNNTPRCPEPMGVGVIDWSLKRRIRLQCSPGRCLPESSSSSFGGYSSDEGFMHQLALQHMSTGTYHDSFLQQQQQQQRNPSAEELATAKWLASTMYYQHPAVHPLPPSMLEDTNSAAQKPGNSRRRDLSSFIHGHHSMHQRIRLPAAGCMGGLGTSMPLNNGEKGNANNDQGMKSKHAKSSIATVSSLLNQRRRDWQQAFRSMFQSWKSKLREFESRRSSSKESFSSKKCNPPTEDELSRCSFYCILPNQVILFRGGYSEGDDASSSTEGGKIVPMIVFSSTTKYLRTKLVSLGIDLRLLTRNEVGSHDFFSEHHIVSDDVQQKEGGIATEKDAESVHAELDAIKWADDEKGKVTVNLKKKAQQNKDDLESYAKIPPLFVSGDDDCAIVYELLVNTCGFSVNVKTEQSKLPSLDVPLLLSRSLGPCMHTSLRTLTIGGRRDCGYMKQSQNNISGTVSQEQQSTSARAAIELRGPILPCALRDLTCAMVNLMLLDKAKQDDQYNQSEDTAGLHKWNDANGESNATNSSSHQFAMFLQAHEGEYTIPTPKSTGSSSSLNFNGSNVPLLPKHENDGDASTNWLECGHGDYMNVLVWDVSRKSVISFSPLSAASS